MLMTHLSVPENILNLCVIKEKLNFRTSYLEMDLIRGRQVHDVKKHQRLNVTEFGDFLPKTIVSLRQIKVKKSEVNSKRWIHVKAVPDRHE